MLSMNDMIEVIGFVSLGRMPEDENEDRDEFTHFFSEGVLSIPRLHAVAIKKLQHCNPLIQNPLENIGMFSFCRLFNAPYLKLTDIVSVLTFSLVNVGFKHLKRKIYQFSVLALTY